MTFYRKKELLRASVSVCAAVLSVSFLGCVKEQKSEAKSSASSNSVQVDPPSDQNDSILKNWLAGQTNHVFFAVPAQNMKTRSPELCFYKVAARGNGEINFSNSVALTEKYTTEAEWAEAFEGEKKVAGYDKRHAEALIKSNTAIAGFLTTVSAIGGSVVGGVFGAIGGAGLAAAGGGAVAGVGGAAALMGITFFGLGGDAGDFAQPFITIAQAKIIGDSEFKGVRRLYARGELFNWETAAANKDSFRLNATVLESVVFEKIASRVRPADINAPLCPNL